MSMIFSANQYDREFGPRRLGNWEVPKWYPERLRGGRLRTRPPPRSTNIIVDEKGHLLPGIRRPKEPPWGRFKGTWDLPRRITRKIANELTAPPRRPTTPPHLSLYERRSASHIPFPEDADQVPKSIIKKETAAPADVKAVSIKDLTPSEIPDFSKKEPSPLDARRRAQGKSKKELLALQPPDGTDAKEDARTSTPPAQVDESVQSNSSRKCPIHGATVPQPPVEVGLSTSCPKPITPRPPTPPKVVGVPLASAYSGFQLAKQLHSDNLKHKPLPDRVDPLFLKNQEEMKSRAAAAVGVRGYAAPGPTQCSKLRVYRPKTAGVLPVHGPGSPGSRPSTTGDLGRRRMKQLSDIDLAICWDFRPDSPSQEPKPPTHIDGSNGSAAPAVFTLVHPPPAEPVQSPKTSSPNPAGTPTQTHHHHPKTPSPAGTPPQMHQYPTKTGTPPHTQLPPAAEFQTACGTAAGCGTPPRSASKKHSFSTDSSCNSISSGSVDKARTQPRTAWSEVESKGQLQDKLERLSASEGVSKVKGKENSSPNVDSGSYGARGMNKGSGLVKRQHYRSSPCIACDTRPLPMDPAIALLNRPRSEYKLAFKAGNPNSLDSGGGGSSSGKGANLKVPKQRQPFAKRSYSINTLAPPFSLWPGNTGQDYPEHWRLASVYQHSYKPPETRKRPLLASVYQ